VLPFLKTEKGGERVMPAKKAKKAVKKATKKKATKKRK